MEDDDIEVLTIDPINTPATGRLWPGLRTWSDILTMALLYLRHRDGTSASVLCEFLMAHAFAIQRDCFLTVAASTTLAHLRHGEQSGVFCSYEQQPQPPISEPCYFVTPLGAKLLMQRVDVLERVQGEEEYILMHNGGLSVLMAQQRWWRARGEGSGRSGFSNYTELVFHARLWQRHPLRMSTELHGSLVEKPTIVPQPPQREAVQLPQDQPRPLFRVNTNYRSPDVVTLSPVRSPASLTVTPTGRKRRRIRRSGPTTTTTSHAHHNGAVDNSCIICHLYEDSGEQWIQCDGCTAWTHVECDAAIGDVFLYHDSNPDCRRYLCVMCRAQQQTILNGDDDHTNDAIEAMSRPHGSAVASGATSTVTDAMNVDADEDAVVLLAPVPPRRQLPFTFA
eukprot:TRINITY_DN3821_c0_g1_i1.p1 TRINITY_DN3821_c0_g1~~TRINITY_DN3821_c0_g1_i1.p1  ORF type:complete len:394 (+),score=79.07 TRINITY_DN3821_c0_g1_i1:49-1230(+)